MDHADLDPNPVMEDRKDRGDGSLLEHCFFGIEYTKRFIEAIDGILNDPFDDK